MLVFGFYVFQLGYVLEYCCGKEELSLKTSMEIGNGPLWGIFEENIWLELGVRRTP